MYTYIYNDNIIMITVCFISITSSRRSSSSSSTNTHARILATGQASRQSPDKTRLDNTLLD